MPTSDSHRDANLLRGFGQSLVDLASFLCPAGHGTDQDGSGQFLSEQAQARVDAFQVQFG